MGNRRNRRSRRLGTLSPERSVERTQVETPNTGKITLTNPDTVVQENLGEYNIGEQLTEPSQISTEIQAWTQIFEQKNNDRIEKMREEMDNKLETILREIKSNKSVSIVTNPRSENDEIQNTQPTGSKGNKSRGVHASNNENSETEDEDFPLKASKMKDLKHPAKPLFQTETDVDVTMHSDDETNSESEQEDYHTMDEPIHKIDFIKYSPSSLATINNNNSNISIIFPRGDAYICSQNSFINLEFEVLKNDNTRYADGDQISLVKFGTVALFSEAKLTTSSGKHLEKVDYLHPISLM